MTEVPCRAHHNPDCKATFPYKKQQRDCPACAKLGQRKRGADYSKWRAEAERIAREKADKAQTSTPEGRKEYQRDYYRAHEEKCKEYQRVYNRTHKKKKKPRKKEIIPRQVIKTAFTGHDLQHLRPEKLAAVINRIFSGEAVFTG